ncbi:MAG: hypothetical protein AAGA66_19525 [Bacteroidota bacterium]
MKKAYPSHKTWRFAIFFFLIGKMQKSVIDVLARWQNVKNQKNLTAKGSQVFFELFISLVVLFDVSLLK